MNKKIISLIFILLFSFTTSCALSGLKIEPLKDKESIKGNFSLILYGSAYLNDLETIAFLDTEGDEFTLKPFASEDQYVIYRGVSDEEALNKAISFISTHSSYSQYKLSNIVDTDDNTIGFEVRPLYYSFDFGTPDVLDINYSLKDKNVLIYIRLNPFVEKNLDNGDRDSDSDGSHSK